MIYENELNSDNNSIMKMREFIKRRFYHEHEFKDNIQIFDSDLSVLLISILSGGFIGILIVACISVKNEINLNNENILNK